MANFGISDELLSTQNVNIARFARNIGCGFLDNFQAMLNETFSVIFKHRDFLLKRGVSVSNQVKIGCHDNLFEIRFLMIKKFYFQALHNIDPLIADFKSALEKVELRLDQFASLCQVEKNVSKTLFHRTKTAVQRLEKQKTLIEQLVHRFVQVVLQIVGGRNIHLIEGPAATDWLYALECVDAFNKVSFYFFLVISWFSLGRVGLLMRVFGHLRLFVKVHF